MASLTQRVREVAMAHGADLVGFAPISRFDAAPAELHPRTIFPPVRTVIALAARQPRGALKAVEEGAYWQAYNCDSYWYLNEVHAPAMLRAVVLALEEEGYTSVPVHNPFHPHTGRPLREDQPAGPDGMVSLRVIGVAAGLGELGLSKLLLTPQFGPRQRVFAVMTDAELEPTPLFAGRLCDECGSCARHCEAGAIGSRREVTFTIEGRTFGHAPLETGHSCPNKKAARFCRNVLAVYPALWTFVRIEGVEPTNNVAERTLRLAVIWRKISFGNWSTAGCRFSERILATVQTLRVQKRHALDYLRQAVAAHRAGQQRPALVTTGA